MFKKSILGGIYIGLAVWINISVCGDLRGAVLFSTGLLAICLQGLFLFTGKAGYVRINSKEDNFAQLLIVFCGNIIGVVLIAFVAINADYEKIITFANNIVLIRTDYSYISIFCKAIGCGILVDLAVTVFKQKNSIIAIFLCVPGFILSGMCHCIADVFYYICLYQKINYNICIIYFFTVLGNFIGCNIRRIFL